MVLKKEWCVTNQICSTITQLSQINTYLSDRRTTGRTGIYNMGRSVVFIHK